MPRTSKSEAPIVAEEQEFEGRYVELGGYTVGFETFRADADPGPLYRGLPGDRCQCPHWGVVLTGRIMYRYADHDEIYEAGDAYYGAPGHRPVVFAGTEVVEFSPTVELQQTMAVVMQNLEAAKAGA